MKSHGMRQFIYSITSLMHQHKSSSVKYSSENNLPPTAYSDASNKIDPNDGKTQYGYNIQFMGGCIIAVSKKNRHCSASVSANEFQATSWCIRAVTWLRYLLEEMGRETYTKPKYWEQTEETQHEELNGTGETSLDQNCFEPELKMPTTVYADNRCSNLWTNENTTTEGNMYIRTSYFMTKEAIRDKIVEIRHVRTKFNISDLLTKSVDKITFERLAPRLLGHMIVDHDEEEEDPTDSAGTNK